MRFSGQDDAATLGGVGVDVQGFVAVAGILPDPQDAITCGATVLSAPNGNGFFSVQFDNTGEIRWASNWNDAMGSGVADDVRALVVGSDGDIWWSGVLQGRAAIAPGNTAIGTANGSRLLVKQNRAGAVKFAGAFGSGGQFASGLALDASGNLVVTGGNLGSVDFGSGALTAVGTPDVFAAEFDATGVNLWAKQWTGNAQSENVGSVALSEPNGDLVLAGGVSGALDFGTGSFNSDTATYGFLGHFVSMTSPPVPAAQWVKFYGGNKAVTQSSVQVLAGALASRKGSAAKDVVLGGEFFKPADFGTGTVGPSSSRSGFVMKVSP